MLSLNRYCLQKTSMGNDFHREAKNINITPLLKGKLYDLTRVVPCSYSHFQILVCLCLVEKPQRQQHCMALPEMKRRSES